MTTPEAAPPPATPSPAAQSPAAQSPAAMDPAAMLRSRAYLALVVLGALLGVPVAVVAYFFLKFVTLAQHWVFESGPSALGFHPTPVWWPLLPLFVCGVIVALSITRLHGTSGHEPSGGLVASGAVDPLDLPGIVLAALATLCLGAVLGPEAPLIAIGSALGVLAVHLVKRDAPPTAALVIGAAGSFAAISTLMGSPIVGAFLLMEAGGIGGPLMELVLVPGLLAAGVGALIFVGLDHWTGFGAFSLSVGPIPHLGPPTGAEFGWAIVIGIAGACLGSAIRRGAIALRPVVASRRLLLTPLAGLVVAALTMVFVETTGRSESYVLFSGQDQLPALIGHAAGWTVGTALLLMACKGLAYGVSLAGFRGGPVFPGIFLGATLGIVCSHLPGLPMVAGVGMGVGAMSVAMLGLPMVSVLLAALLLSSDGVTLMPLIIVAVVVSYVASAHVGPRPAPASEPAPAPGPGAMSAAAPEPSPS